MQISAFMRVAERFAFMRGESLPSCVQKTKLRAKFTYGHQFVTIVTIAESAIMQYFWVILEHTEYIQTHFTTHTSLPALLKL